MTSLSLVSDLIMTCQFLNMSVLIYLKISNNLFNKYFLYFIFLNRIY